jgi:transcriptional pleiotropic regulator of transition state genes
LDLDIKDPLEIDVNGDEILLKKYVPRCIFCKSIEDVKEVKGKCICRECLDRIKAL